MAEAFDSQYLPREKNVLIAYGQWLDGLSQADYLAELDRVRNHGIGNAT